MAEDDKKGELNLPEKSTTTTAGKAGPTSEPEKSGKDEELTEAAKKPRLKPVLLLTVLAVAFGNNFGIYNTSVVNNLKPSVVGYLNETEKGSWISGNPETVWAVTVSAFTAGSAVGTLCSTALAENFGRKTSLLISAGINVIGSLMCLFYLYLFELALIGRLCMGVSLGLGIPLASAFITEISPVAYRGRLNAVLQTAFGLGDLLGMVLSVTVLLGRLERSNYALSLTLVLSLLQIVVLAFAHDSPRFLILKKNRLDDGQAAVEFYQGKSVTAEIVKEIQAEQTTQSADDSPRFWTHFKRKPFLLACIMLTTNALTGIPIIVAFSTDSFTENRVPRYVELCTVILGLSNFVGSFVAIYLMETWGRKPLMITGLFGCFTCVTFFTISSLIITYTSNVPTNVPYVVVVWLILFFLFFSLNGAALNTLAAEICPQTYRSLAVSMANFCLMLFSTVLILLYEPTKQKLGQSWVFFPSSLISVLLTLYLILAIPETKNKTITEIQRHFET